jgi:hypothetical protein
MAMRSILAVLGAVLLGSPLASAGELSVKLNLTERAGVARTAEPVSGGVPLPAGTIKDVAELAVLDAAGKPVPAQFAVLNKHWDTGGSPKWVLVIFQADVPASGKAVYTLATGQKNPAPAAAVSVKQEAGSVAVSTGALDVVIDTGKLSLFKSVKVGGQELIAEGTEAGFVVEGMDGVRYATAKDLVEPVKVTVLEGGPVRASILVEGVVKAGNNAKGYEVADGKGGTAKLPGRDGEKLGFSIRYEFYAGKPFCRVFHTVRCLTGTPYGGPGEDKDTAGWIYYVDRGRQPGNFFAKAAELVVNLKLDGAAKYVLGGDADPFDRAQGRELVERHAGELAAGENACVYQASSAGWTWQVAENRVFDPGLKSNAEFMKKSGKDKPYYEYSRTYYEDLTKREGCPFMGYKWLAGKRGAEAEKLQGNRAAGWVDLAGGGGGATVALRYFWEMYPKSLEAGADGRLVVGLWPRRWERGHLFEGRVHRTHETLWYFHAGDAAAARSAEAVRAFNAPCYVLCDPEWYIEKTDAFAAAAVAGKVEYGDFDGWAKTAVHNDYSKGKLNYSFDSSFEVEREKYDEFGVWHFGDGSKGGDSAEGGGGGHLWYFSQSTEFDTTYTLLLHLARTGDPAFLATGEQTGRHVMGVVCHEGGYGHQWLESSHAWSRGLGIYCLLTGLWEAREALFNWAFEYHLQSGLTEYHGKNNAWNFNGRNAAWCIRGLYNAYDFTGEKKYLDELGRGLDIVRQRQDKSSGQFGGGAPMSFQMGTVIAALGEHAWRTGDEEALDALLGMTAYFAAIRGKGDWVSPWVADGFAYSYLLTGYSRYRELAEAGGGAFKKFFSDTPHYRMGTASPKGWTDYMRNLQPYLHMKAYPRKDEAPPAAVKDLAVDAAGGGKVTVTLTAPGDNGAEGGKAARYQLKYAASEIVEDSREAKKGLSFWAATNAKGEPAPGAAGAKEKFEISGIKPGKYWFAVKARDAAENLSDISNVVAVEVK